MRTPPFAWLLLPSLVLSACGGGGSGAITTPPPADPGARIVFARQTTANQPDIYLIREDGSGEIALANSSDPENFLAFTTDGRVIYERMVGPAPGISDLYSVKLDGTDRQVLSATADQDQFYALTKTNKVIFLTFTPERGAALNAIDPDGTDRVVLADSTDDESIAGLTQSGRVIYNSQNSNGASLISINADGTGRVTLGTPTDATGCSFSAAVATRIILDCSFIARGGDVYAVSETGGALTGIAADLALDEYLMSPTPSGQLVIARNDEQANQLDLYLGTVDGGPLVPLATSLAGELPVTSTLTRVLYRAYDTPSSFETRSVRLDGTGMVTLQPPATEPLYFQFTTASEKLVFQWSRAATRTDLLALNADGTGALVLASGPGDDVFLAADNTRVIYQSIENNVLTGLSSANIATGASTLLVPAGSELRFARLLPSGRVLLRKPGTGPTLDDDIYIVNADGTGSRPLVQTTAREFVSGIAP